MSDNANTEFMVFFFFQAEDGIRDVAVTGVQTCALPIFGLVDGILEQLLPEMGRDTNVIATGGLAPLIGNASKYIKTVDDHLTLEGLRIIWERNASPKRETARAAGSLETSGAKSPEPPAAPKPAASGKPRSSSSR